MQTNLNTLQVSIGYTFKNRTLLEKALKHSSLEVGIEDNERLEFLGDAVLNLVTAETFYLKFPDLKEGELSRMRTHVIKGSTLAAKALELRLDKHLVVSEAQRLHHPEPSKAMLEDALEALIGAIYLDGGLEASRHSIERIFGEALCLMNDHLHQKNQLQEWVHKHHKGAQLVYKIVSTDGPDHDRTYRSTVILNDVKIGQGNGSSKKAAEVAAAHNALEKLEG